MRSLRYGNDYYRKIDQIAYNKAYSKLIARLLEIGKVRLAVLSDDHDVVLGFSVYRGKVLDYLFVHKEQRRQGIGADLIPEGIEEITHLTKMTIPIWEKKYGKLRFNPFA